MFGQGLSAELSAQDQQIVSFAWEKLVRSRSGRDVLHNFASAVCEVSGADRCCLVRSHEEDFVFLHGNAHNGVGSSLPNARTAFHVAISLRTTVVLADLPSGVMRVGRDDTVVRAIAAIPLDDEDVEAVGLYWTRPATLSVGQIEVVKSMGRTAAFMLRQLQERSEQAMVLDHLELCRDEIRHRLKNAYASAIGLAGLTMPREIAKEFGSRVQSLVTSYDLLDRISGESSAIPLNELFVAVLESYQLSEDHPISLAGPDVAISADKVSGIGLIVNELATNALKYGALSVETGVVEIEWLQVDNELLISWLERDGPSLGMEELKSQTGSTLVEKIARHQLGGIFERTVSASGLRCSLRFPL